MRGLWGKRAAPRAQPARGDSSGVVLVIILTVFAHSPTFGPGRTTAQPCDNGLRKRDRAEPQLESPARHGRHWPRPLRPDDTGELLFTENWHRYSRAEIPAHTASRSVCVRARPEGTTVGLQRTSVLGCGLESRSMAFDLHHDTCWPSSSAQVLFVPRLAIVGSGGPPNPGRPQRDCS